MIEQNKNSNEEIDKKENYLLLNNKTFTRENNNEIQTYRNIKTNITKEIR
jgi:hypothetical protein